MRNIVYVNTTHNFRHSELFFDSINKLKCSKLYKEENDEASRPAWSQFIDDLQDGDTATFMSLNNAFRNITEILMFLKLCSAKNIRIISIFDSLDSEDSVFTNSCTKNTFEAISKLPLCSDYTNERFSTSKLRAINARNARLRKYQLVVNMYKGGYNIQEIMNYVKIKSKSTIYDILHRYNIRLDYPKMVRTKNEALDEEQKIRMNKL